MSAGGRNFCAQPVVSLGLAVLTAVAATFVLMLVGEGPARNLEAGDAIAFGLYDGIIAAACFVICRNNPAGAWYVLIASNAAGLLAVAIEPTIWRHGEWLFIMAGWLISGLAAMAGAARGRRRDG